MNSAKSIIKFVLLICLLTVGNPLFVRAQDTLRAKRKEAKALQVKQMIDTRNFIFIPQFVTPLRGARRQVDPSYYFLDINKDSLTSYLPYFGRAFTAPLSSSDIMFDFTSTHFDYAVTINKKGAWEITIRLKDQTDVQQLLLTVFNNGTTSLSVNTNNRDPISFDGYLKKPKEKK